MLVPVRQQHAVAGLDAHRRHARHNEPERFPHRRAKGRAVERRLAQRPWGTEGESSGDDRVRAQIAKHIAQRIHGALPGST